MQSKISLVAAELQKVLGRALVAVIAVKDVRAVARWTAANPAKPSTRDSQRLRDTLQVQQLLLTADAPDLVRAWFMGMNPELNDETPAEALVDGRAREVMAAARAFVNAVWPIEGAHPLCDEFVGIVRGRTATARGEGAGLRTHRKYDGWGLSRCCSAQPRCG